MGDLMEKKEEDIICIQIAKGIECWLHDIGHKINEYENRTDREGAILNEVYKFFSIGKKFAQDNLSNNTPRWIASVLYNEGYGKQCMEVGPFEGTKEEAENLCEEKITEMFSDCPNTDIIDFKIKRYTN